MLSRDLVFRVSFFGGGRSEEQERIEKKTHFFIQQNNLCLRWHPFTLASAPQDPFLIIVIKDVGDWTHALHELVREKGEARDGRLSVSAASAKPTSSPASPSYSLVSAASLRDFAVPSGSSLDGRDLESQLSAAAIAAEALPPLPPGVASSLTAAASALARGGSLCAPLPPLFPPAAGEQPPLTKRVSFAEEKVEALVEEATKDFSCDKHRPAPSPSLPPPSASQQPPKSNPIRRRRRTRDSDIPYTFSIDGPWGAPTQVRFFRTF